MLRTIEKPSIRYGMFPLIFVFLVLSTLPLNAELPVIKSGDKLESPFVKVYEKVAPSVVRVNVKAEVSGNRQRTVNPWQFFFENPPQNQKRRVPGIGSGVIVNREGYILTNNHVIAGSDEIEVKINEDETYEAEVVGKDPETDLAVIKVKLDGKLLPAEYVAELGDSDTIKPGDYAIAIGNPIGLDRSITVGVVSAIGRYNLNPVGARELRFKDFIQTDAQINPGNSGGALADINGRVIGINNIYSAEFAGIGFAVPINLARKVMNQLIANGEVTRGFVGIDGRDIDPDYQEALELSSKKGVFIKSILPDSPAEEIGLEHGDVILTLNGQEIKDMHDFLFKIADISPGTTIQLGIIHEGKSKTVSMKLANRKKFNDIIASTPNIENSTSWRGIYVVDVTNPQAKNFNLGNIENGAVVVSIDPDSPAADTKLATGDVIIEVTAGKDKKTRINNAQDFLMLKEKYKDLKKSILIYRMRRSSDGTLFKGYVAVGSE